jgi:heat shock protein HspQ
LNGEIFYFSKAKVGGNDQYQWNEKNLQDRFVGKFFGVMGDGEFAFNRKNDVVQNIGYKPHRRKHGILTEDEAKYSCYLSQMRVIIENTISRIKQWRIFKEMFRHWRNGCFKKVIFFIFTEPFVPMIK